MSETCDTCGESCQGGVRHDVDAAGHDRIGCDDDHACADAWSRLSPYDRKHPGHDCRAIRRDEEKARVRAATYVRGGPQ